MMKKIRTTESSILLEHLRVGRVEKIEQGRILKGVVA